MSLQCLSFVDLTNGNKTLMKFVQPSLYIGLIYFVIVLHDFCSPWLLWAFCDPVALTLTFRPENDVNETCNNRQRIFELSTTLVLSGPEWNRRTEGRTAAIHKTSL